MILVLFSIFACCKIVETRKGSLELGHLPDVDATMTLPPASSGDYTVRRQYTKRNFAIYRPLESDETRSSPGFVSVSIDGRNWTKHQPIYNYTLPQQTEDHRQHVKQQLVSHYEQVQSLGTDTDEKGDRGKEFTMSRGAKGWTHHIKSWAPEAAWCVIAGVLLGALVILLMQYNNQRLPEWPLGLTLNTAVALITTVLRSVTVVLISEAISQLKWNRFAVQQRRISDLHVFDQASRGPWGSLLMVLRGRGGYVDRITTSY